MPSLILTQRGGGRGRSAAIAALAHGRGSSQALAVVENRPGVVPAEKVITFKEAMLIEDLSPLVIGYAPHGISAGLSHANDQLVHSAYYSIGTTELQPTFDVQLQKEHTQLIELVCSDDRPWMAEALSGCSGSISVGTSLPELYFYVCHNRGPSCTCADCHRGNYLAYGWEFSDDEADIEFMLPPLPKAPRLQEEASSSTTVAESGPPTTRASPAAAESGLHTTMAFMAPPAAVESWPAATMAPPAAAERAESGPMTTTMAPPAVSESEPTTTTAAPAMAENEPMTTMAPPAAVESGRPTTTTAMAPPAAVGSGPTTTMAPPAVAESGRSLPELPLASLPAVAESGRSRPLLELLLALEFIGPPGALKQARLRLAPDVNIHFEIKSNCARLYAIPKNDVEIEGGSSIEVRIHMKSSIASGSDAAANVIANHKFRAHVSGDGRSELVILAVSGLVEDQILPVLRV